MKKLTFTDQLGNSIRISSNPKRIVSLVPSQTELLHYFGLEQEVVGITKFCISPNHWFREKERVGGTKKVNFKKVISLQPDIIIGNREENVKDQIEEMSQLFPVWMSDIIDLNDAIDMIREIGLITGKSEIATSLVGEITHGFNRLTSEVNKRKGKPTVAYLVWNDPLMAAGKGTFIDAMLQKCGLANVFENVPGRYPTFTMVELKEMNPDIVLLSSEPFPFRNKHRITFEQVLPKSKVIFVDGTYFSWYGSRLAFAPDRFLELIKSF